MRTDTLERLPERFRTKITARADGCWQWNAGGRGAYGVYWDSARRRQVAAHRFAYESLFGPIPAGLEIDHLCNRPSYVNPAHLEAVTHSENVARGWARNPRGFRR